MKYLLQELAKVASKADRIGIIIARAALIVVLLWIGGIKACKYEDDSIVPFVANNPVLKHFYTDPSEYKTHMNPEGALVPANRQWHQLNGTYVFGHGLGLVIISLGIMLCLHPWLPQIAAIGSFLVILMSFTTLSFLITTPECWVPPLGDAHHGFPYLSGPGRLVIKDVIMLGAAIITMADSAKAYLGLVVEAGL